MTTNADPARATVIYDDDCGFCRWCLAVLLRAGLRASRPLPLGTEEADRLLADLTEEQRDASWHVVIDDERFSAGVALVPALALLPGGRRAAALLARVPRLTERAYRWIADHRGLLGRFVQGRARRWADRVIAAHGGPVRPQ